MTASASPSAPPAAAAAISRTMSAADVARLLVLALLWGSSFFFVEIILRDLDAFTLVAGRTAIAAAALWILAAFTGGMTRSASVWAAFAVLGLLNNAVPFTLLTLGQTEISSSLASILNATTPLFTALIAGVALADERLSVSKLLGIGTGLAGVAVMMGPDVRDAPGLGASAAGQLACLGAACSYGFALVFARRFKRMGVRPREVATGQLTASALIMAGVAAFAGAPAAILSMGSDAALALAALGVASTALAYLIFFRLVSNAGATNASLVTFLVPATAILLGVLLLDERPDAAEILGMILILAGLALIDGRFASHARARFGRG